MCRVINIKQAPRGWESNPDYVYIGRPRRGQDGYFGNPFIPKYHGNRTIVACKFEAWARERIEKDPIYRQRVKELKDKILICFCAPLACHGHILVKLCDELNGE